MTNLFIDLMSKIMQYEPEKRITPGMALKHPWIAKYVTDLKQKLQESKKKNASAKNET